MAVPLDQLHLGTVLHPYFQTQPAALAFWLLINLASFGFEFIQWQQRRAEATNADKGSYALLLTCAAAGLVWLVVASIAVPAAMIRPTSAAFAVGITLFLAGFGMRRWSEMTLGRYFTFTVMISADQPVIASGPYRLVRHPGYTAALVVIVPSTAIGKCETPQPRTRAAVNFDRSEMVVFIEPAARTLLRWSCSCGWPWSFQPSARLAAKPSRHTRLVRVMPSRSKLALVRSPMSSPSPCALRPCSMTNCSKMKPSPEKLKRVPGSK